ncbi:unnamed protein product [Brassicogethes aeneus]|uniref:Clip domain-containing protein n=1 Tax=Brassicogethes aeneus TaxID=1431903 RepID=A0A9P0B6N3_BRAAE|nr:unnamed protein product [Brassicogethes aeneus]
MFASYMFSVLLLLATVNGKFLQDTCLTPNSERGICINLQECPPIFALSNDFTNQITLEILKFLIGSQCGFVKSNAKVCCPLSELNKEDISNQESVASNSFVLTQ